MPRIPINIATGSLQQNELIVGIDLGTTNSLIAIVHPDSGEAVALKEHNGIALVPSLVHVAADGNITVGEEAKPLLESDPQNTVFSIKRLMGKTLAEAGAEAAQLPYKVVDDGQGGAAVQLQGKIYTPVQISALILKALKARAEHILKTEVSKVVITVPAYFNDGQRQATREAGKLAGLDVLRIINEPTASSLAYGIGSGKGNELVAVYDLGGGTFDISILQITDGVFEVLSTHGDTHLGGDDFDQCLVDLLMRMHGYEPADLSTDAELTQSLRLKAEDVKKYLSEHEEFHQEWNGQPLHITRAQFNEMVQPLVERTLASCRQALADAGLKASDIQQVVMVGGSTRVPLVKDQVAAFFGRPVHDDVNPDEVVALGAALQADVLAGNNKTLLLLDVTPLSLGIETMGGLMEVLIPRNSKIPGRAGRQFTTSKDGQGNLRISVFQGERDLVKDNRLLGEFHLKGIPAMPAGFPKVEITFLINADGILVVTAKELRSGVEQSIEINPKEKLTDEALEKMLLDGMQNAEADIAARALAEAEVEGEQILKTTEAFLHKNMIHLTKEEITNTAHAMQALQLALTMKDKKLIQEKQQELNAISEPYAQRVMDEAISQAMKGQKI